MKCLICITGPTAVGKTALSLRLARSYRTEILSGDSRQMYRYMDIGTAKPSLEERAEIPHHFINCLNPDEGYSAGQFEREADQLIQTLFKKHDVLLVTGGSTLYMNALWNGFNDMPDIPPEIRDQLTHEWQNKGLSPLLEELNTVDPQTYQQIDRQNPARIIRALEVFRASGKPISAFRTGRPPKQCAYQLLKIGLMDEREVLYHRINQRVLAMLEAGLEEECRQLLTLGYSPDMRALQAIGYGEIYQYFAGETTKAEAISLIQRNSRRYAKRQLTYYRKFPDIHWFQAGDWEAVDSWIQESLL
ncbi:MAG: tRNA (adenosine(37)-N6)-dimethylallyltransferase MiaA [Bacteroidota bacterium]